MLMSQIFIMFPFFISPKRSSILKGPLECIQCLCRVYICKYLLVCMSPYSNVINEIVLSSPSFHSRFRSSYMDDMCNGTCSCCLKGYDFQDFYKSARSILMFPPRFFSKNFARVKVILP